MYPEFIHISHFIDEQISIMKDETKKITLLEIFFEDKRQYFSGSFSLKQTDHTVVKQEGNKGIELQSSPD